MIIQATKLANRCLKDKVITGDTIINDFDALGSALQASEIQKCQVFSPSTLMDPTEPNETMLIILSDPWTVVPSASVSLEQNTEKEKPFSSDFMMNRTNIGNIQERRKNY